MSATKAKLKAKAEKAIAAKKFGHAAAAYRDIVEEDPDDLAAWQRLGELQAKSGDNDAAIKTYLKTALKFSRAFEPLKSIALCKLVLELEPGNYPAEMMLEKLYDAKKKGVGQKKPPPSAAPAPTKKLDASQIRGAVLDAGKVEAAKKEVKKKKKKKKKKPVAEAGQDATSTAVDIPIVDTSFDEPTLEHSSAFSSKIDESLDLDRAPPIPLFSELPRDAFLSFAHRMTLKRVEPGTTIIQEQSDGDSMYVLIQGRVAVHRQVQGKMVQLAMLTDGTFFGEMALLANVPRTASITAVEPSTLFEIDRSLVDEISSNYPAVRGVMDSFFEERLHDTLVRTSSAFKKLDDAAKKNLAKRFRLHKGMKGDIVLEQQSKSRGIFVVLLGTLEAIKREGEKATVLGKIETGDIFGELSTLGSSPTTADVRCVSDAVMLLLPASDFNAVAATYPEFVDALQETAMKRARENRERGV